MTRLTTFQGDLLKKTLLGLGAFIMIALIIVIDVVEVSGLNSKARLIQVKLERGPLTVYDFPSTQPTTTAIIIFGSGDGGWSDFEEAISQAFQSQGYEVIGVDFRIYAQTDYDLDCLQSDYNRIARMAQARFGTHPPPLIFGGYSMGAAQAIAAAGGPRPPEGLVGLLLVDPCSRGRYGLRSSDQLDVLPSGPGTFGVAEFTRTIDPLRVVQWHAGNDTIDSASWLDSMTAPHKILVFPNDTHVYESNRPDFIRQLVESAAWLLNPTEPSMASRTATSP